MIPYADRTRVLIVFGTRPEAIKMIPVIRARNEGWYEQLEVPLVEIAVREAAALPSQLWCTLNMSACTVFDDAVTDTQPADDVPSTELSPRSSSVYLSNAPHL